MDTAMIFAVLGIKETKDEDQIRQAYHRKLTENNPEDDPEGFRRLREAYEQATAYAKEEEKAEEEEDLTPIGRWIKKVQEIYFCLSKRLDVSVWQELLRDEICVDLEYAEEAKWRMFRFFADHYRLNSLVYRVLDEFFGIVEGEKEFKEHLPIAFVDYMIYKIQDTQGSSDFPYQWIEGSDTADYDTFQDQLQELEGLLSEEKEKEARQVVTAMEQLGITHPFYQAAKARLALLEGDRETALTAQTLLEKYPESVKIQVLSAHVLWDCGEKETAAKAFQKVQNQFGTYYIVEKCLAQYEKEKGNLAKAIRHCLRVLQKSEDEAISEMLKELDQDYLAECEKKTAEGTLSAEDACWVCGSYIRSGRILEGIDFLLGHPEYIEKDDSMLGYLAKMYYEAEKYEESIEQSKKSVELLLKHMEETEKGSEEEKEEKLIVYRRNLAVSYSYEAMAICVLVRQNLEDEKTGNYTYQDAENIWKEALKYEPNNVSIKQDLLDLLIESEQYEKAVELADEILAWNNEWFPALVKKQEACYQLERAQEVVDLFYQAKELYPSYSKIYELAVNVFCDYRQFQDAERVLAQAREQKAEGFGLDLAELHCKEMQSRCDIEYYETLKKAEELLKKFEEGNATKTEFAKLYFEMAVLEYCQYYKEFIHPGKAEEYIKKAIDLRKNESLKSVASYYFTYGQILCAAEKYREAIDAYLVFAQQVKMTEMTAMNLAKCYDKLGEWEEAVKFYKTAISINPQQKDANGKIAAIYEREGDNKNSMPLVRIALQYQNRQIELEPVSAYQYRKRGIIYKILGDMEHALEDATKAIQIDKRNPYGLNLKGRILYYMEKYQQALFYYKKSISNLKDPKKNGWAMYTNAAECCQKMGNFKQAEDWYKKGIALFEGSDLAWCYWELVQFYKGQRRYQEAFALLKESYENGAVTEENYLLRYFAIQKILCKDIEQAKKLEQEVLQVAEKFDSVEAWEEVSDIQYFYLFDKEKAIQTKKLVIERIDQSENSEKWWRNRTRLIERMQIYWELGNKQEMEKYKEMYIQTIERHYDVDTEEYPSVKQYLEDPLHGYENLCDMIYYWIFTGQLEQAWNGIEQARGMKFCRDCRHCECVKLEEAEAVYYEAIGERKKAYQLYCAIYQRWPASALAYYKMEVLKDV